MIEYRLIVPIKRSKHAPQYTARAVAVGIFWAFTPLIGIHMYLVFLTWLAARYSERTGFNLLVALPWTWITNVFTLLPTYYAFYVTGVLILHGHEAHLGYGSFVARWKEILFADLGIWETILRCVKLITTEQGIPMVVGCIPYAVGGAWLGYLWSVRYLERRRARRLVHAHSKARGHLARTAADTQKFG